MIWGTGASVGKSIVTFAVCRMLARMGLRVVPFKPIAVSRGTVVLGGVGPISPGVGCLDEACMRSPSCTTNPLLLVPTGEGVDSDVLNRDYEVDAYLCGRFYGRAMLADIHASASQFGVRIQEELRLRMQSGDILVIEGAGNPAEGDVLGRLANCSPATWADAAVLLVTDCDRGAPISGALGTWELLGAERRRVAGLILNRGWGRVVDETPARIWESRTGVPVLGDLPYSDRASSEAAAMRDAAAAQCADRVRCDAWYDLLSAAIGPRLRLGALLPGLDHKMPGV